MPDKISAIILTDNNLESATLTLKTVLSFGDNLIDSVTICNYAGNPDDKFPFDDGIKYVCYRGEDFPGFPKVINSIVKEEPSSNDILIVCKSIMMAPGCVKNMYNELHSYERAGMAVCCMNGVSSNHSLPQEIADYKAASEYALNGSDKKTHRITLGDHRVMLLSREAFDRVGGFNEDIRAFSFASTDLYFKLTFNKINIIAVPNAVAWNLATDVKEPAIDEIIGTHDFEVLTRDWGLGYYNKGGNRAIISLIDKKPDEAFRVLEIGCSKGDTLLDIKEEYPNSEVYGVELDDNAAKLASNFCEAITGNIENEDLPYEEESFDYIIMADVLEHLHDPAKSLEYVKRFLKPDGKFLASIPNVQHISVIKDLLKGYFTYTPVGLLDHTHIHLFTWYEISRMFDSCGFKTGVICYTQIPISDEEKDLLKKLEENVEVSEHFMFEAFQYVFAAEKKPD